jgi:hypothetical protein
MRLRALLWRGHAHKLQAVLDHQNKGYYEAAKERDRLIFENAKYRIWNRLLSAAVILSWTFAAFIYLCYAP